MEGIIGGKMFGAGYSQRRNPKKEAPDLADGLFKNEDDRRPLP